MSDSGVGEKREAPTVADRGREVLDREKIHGEKLLSAARDRARRPFPSEHVGRGKLEAALAADKGLLQKTRQDLAAETGHALEVVEKPISPEEQLATRLDKILLDHQDTQIPSRQEHPDRHIVAQLALKDSNKLRRDKDIVIIKEIDANGEDQFTVSVNGMLFVLRNEHGKLRSYYSIIDKSEESGKLIKLSKEIPADDFVEGIQHSIDWTLEKGALPGDRDLIDEVITIDKTTVDEKAKEEEKPKPLPDELARRLTLALNPNDSARGALARYRLLRRQLIKQGLITKAQADQDTRVLGNAMRILRLAYGSRDGGRAFRVYRRLRDSYVKAGIGNVEDYDKAILHER